MPSNGSDPPPDGSDPDGSDDAAATTAAAADDCCSSGGAAEEACGCDCHSIARAGREAVVAKLLEGMDFSPLFENSEGGQETEAAADDVDADQELKEFEMMLNRAHGWCAVAKGCSH